MRAYKGFTKTEDGKLMCLNMEYEPGKTYKHEGKIEICMCGYHACHELHQVWYYYPNNGYNVFYEVECGRDVIESKDGSGKFVCSEITLIKEVDVSDVAKFNDVYDFFEGFARVKLDGKWNFISTEGRVLSKQWFDYAWNFSDGFARVEINGKQNFVNTEGKLLSDQWFDYASYFHEGFSRVRIGGNVKRINKKGEIF